MSRTYMRKEKGDQTIVCVSLSNWGRYRSDGYVFVANDGDGNTPQQQFLNQVNAAAASAKADGSDELPTMDSKKPEIIAYLEANGIEHDPALRKADLLELVV